MASFWNPFHLRRMEQVRKEVQENNAAANAQAKPNFAYGYGGKYGVQEDRQDKVCPVLACSFPPYICSWYLCMKSSWTSSLLLSNTRPNSGDLHLYPCGSGLVAPRLHLLGLHPYPLPLHPGRMQAAVGHEYQAPASKHSSQVDQKRGFGGEFGLQDQQVSQSTCHFLFPWPLLQYCFLWHPIAACCFSITLIQPLPSRCPVTQGRLGAGL